MIGIVGAIIAAGKEGIGVGRARAADYDEHRVVQAILSPPAWKSATLSKLPLPNAPVQGECIGAAKTRQHIVAAPAVQHSGAIVADDRLGEPIGVKLSALVSLCVIASRVSTAEPASEV